MRSLSGTDSGWSVQQDGHEAMATAFGAYHAPPGNYSELAVLQVRNENRRSVNLLLGSVIQKRKFRKFIVTN
jgi:hypothetical protein